MVSKELIRKTFDSILKHNHISNEEIRTRVNGMSLEEKKEALEDKMNPFEKKDYDDLYTDLDLWENIVADEQAENVDNPHSKKELEKTKEAIFLYEKRIVRGYDLDKNKDKAPEYDLNDFNEEKYGDGENDIIEKLEQSQLDFQEKHMFIDGEHILENSEINSLKAYFGKKSGQINSQLSMKYKNGLWEELPSDIKNEYMEDNKKLIPNIDSAMDKSPRLEVATIVYHGVQDSHIVDIHSRIGDTVKLDGFISTSYNEKVGRSYSEIIGNKRLYVRFLLPEGTRGICANDKHLTLTNYPFEHEYLLDRNQKGSIVDIDYDKGMVTVLVE